MKKRVITEGIVNSFKRYLIESEKADATIQKYIHDIHCPAMKNIQIPKSVTSLFGTFEYCEKLENVPEISENVTDMCATFRDCVSLKGEIIINANPKDCRFCFEGVDFAKQNLELFGKSEMLDKFKATGVN